MAQDPWAVVSQTPIQPKTTASADPWAVVSQTPTQSPSTSPTPAQSPLVTAGEGTYQMTGPDAKPQPVSYSNVAKARQQGYHFADQKHLEQYAHDFNADPKNAHAVDTWLHNQPWWNLPAGAVKAASGVGASVEDLVAGADRLVRKVTGTKLTGPEESLQISAAKPTDGVQAGAGYAGEQVGELIAIPEEIPGKLAEITRLGEGVDALSKIERVKEITQLLDKYPALKTAVGIGLKVVGQGAKAGVEQGGQALVHSGGDVEQTKQAAEFGALGGGAAATAPDLLGAAGQFSKNVLRNRFNIETHTAELEAIYSEVIAGFRPDA